MAAPRTLAVDLAWLLAMVAGLAVSGFLFHFPGSFGLPALDASAMLFGGLIGAVSGAFVGVLLWLSTTRTRAIGGRLIGWMAIGCGVTHGLLDGLPSSLGIGVAAVACALAVTGAYAWLIADRRSSALVWIGAGWSIGLLLAWFGSSALGLPAEETPVGWATDHLVEGVIVGLTFGTATIVARTPEQLRIAA